MTLLQHLLAAFHAPVLTGMNFQVMVRAAPALETYLALSTRINAVVAVTNQVNLQVLSCRETFIAHAHAPIPTRLLKECASVLVPTITNIVNFSLTSGQFHPILKESVISPLLKKSTLDKHELSNYRPISNLSVISKIIERVVKSRLIDHLTFSKLLNQHISSWMTANLLTLNSSKTEFLLIGLKNQLAKIHNLSLIHI